MTIYHIELRGSRTGTDATDKSSTAELVFGVYGSTNPITCRTYLADEDVVPDEYDGLVFRSLSWEHHGNDAWEFTAHYVHPDISDRNQDLDVGDYSFSFDTSGGSVTRSVSLATTKYAKSGETAADFKGAIGVKKNGPDTEVEGVEIGIPALKFSIRKRVPRATLSLEYVKLLCDMTFHTNSSAFFGFPAGELLFTGASGQEGTDSDPEVTYNFIASPNATGLVIGDITGVAKLGHEYLWVYFEDSEDDSAKKTVKRPLSCYVEQVYESANFSALGIV